MSAKQRVSANKDELEKLQSNLEAITSIVEKYKIHGAGRVLNHRIEMFCECVVVFILFIYISDAL